MRLPKSEVLRRSLRVSLIRHLSTAKNCSNKLQTKKIETFTSKNVRDLFLKYFTNEKKHTYIHSSPVFLNNDPSLLFVNAGMNQFRSLLLNKTYAGHPFHGLKRATNSQKCVRLSGKHNDLKDVGVDLYHHTFFEMLGNWSFGDYSKFDACKMAWELLTNIYGLPSQNLYVTYFGGDEHLGIPPDEECKRIWLEIGVHPNHIFPFGAKDNFWEMGDKGPCGPCTEVHYDFCSSGHQIVAQKINADSPDVMEIWNLVFVQYNRESENVLKSIPTLHIDTGMGFERLCAVLQGTQSNYDTDIFKPLFQAIQSNFKVRPYQGKTGSADVDGLDTAYRILADHSRMFSVAIADGLFPDSYDAGHVLRKIIRRAAYTANCEMKTRAGALSSLVPYVAETLDFFPEVNKHVNEIIYIVNEEEKMFHQVVNRGRKARNKLMTEGSRNVLDGHQIWELHEFHGLEFNVVQDLASEVNLIADWDHYEKVKIEKLQSIKKQSEEKANIALSMANNLKSQDVPLSNDSYKYNYNTNKNNHGVESIRAKVVAILKDQVVASEAEEGNHSILVTDKTNFYSEAGGQISDIGKIYNEDFAFKVENVTSSHGYVFHHGVVTEGKIKASADVFMDIDKDRRLSCAQNHTATHILNAALRKVLHYTTQRSSFVGPTHLRFGFSSRSPLTVDQLEEIENYANQVIQNNLKVSRNNLMFEELLNQPKAILLRGEEYPEIVSVISIENTDGSEPTSIEPCCGTHVLHTADIESLLLIPSKSHGGSTKFISAVTGKHASFVRENGKALQKRIFDLKCTVDETLKKINVSLGTHLDLLKQVNKILRECQLKYDAPLLELKKYENILKDLKLKLTDVIDSASKEVPNLESAGTSSQQPKVEDKVMEFIKMKKILPTNDRFKYDYFNKEVKPISAKALVIIRDNEIVDHVKRGFRCQIVLDQTNFYAEDDDQAGDEGLLSSEDYVVKINSVYKVEDYVFHDGFVEEGNAVADCSVNLLVDQKHRLACSQNHTAVHLLNSALKSELPYFFPHSASAGPKELQLIFTAKLSITDDQLKIIEKNVNRSIHANMDVKKIDVPVESLNEVSAYKSSFVNKCKEYVPTISINKAGNENLLKSMEPCSGTEAYFKDHIMLLYQFMEKPRLHKGNIIEFARFCTAAISLHLPDVPHNVIVHVTTTADIGSFIITAQKTHNKKERIIRAVTGEQAIIVEKDGNVYDKQLIQLENHAFACLEKQKVDYLELWDCLKEIKIAKAYHETELPLLLFRQHQSKLSVLTKKLTEATSDFVQDGFEKVKCEMQTVSREFSDERFIVYMLSSVGDGKKIINYAIENSADKPSLYFVRDGHRSIICSCSVPKSFISPAFSALLWINPVASVLEGQARNLTKDQELFYSVVSNRMERLDQAIIIAKDYAASHLGNN